MPIPTIIHFDLTHVSSKKAFAKQLANPAYMLKNYGLPITLGQEDGTGTVWTHEMVSEYLGGTDHIDPVEYWVDSADDYFNSDYDESDFLELVQAYYNSL